TFSDLQAHSTTSIKRPPARQTQTEKSLAKSQAALFFNAITPGLYDSELRFSLFHLWESRNRELRIGFEVQLFNKILEGLTVNYLRGAKARTRGLKGVIRSCVMHASSTNKRPPEYICYWSQDAPFVMSLIILQTTRSPRVMYLSQAVLNSDCDVYNRCAYLKLSNYFIAIYNSLDEDETLRKLI
ncbi:hypothetical protein HID58_014732, partial [Brassica napus]